MSVSCSVNSHVFEFVDTDSYTQRALASGVSYKVTLRKALRTSTSTPS